jgi:hypothetical protein
MKTALCSSFFASLQSGSDFKEDALAISEQSWPSLTSCSKFRKIAAFEPHHGLDTQTWKKRVKVR